MLAFIFTASIAGAAIATPFGSSEAANAKESAAIKKVGNDLHYNPNAIDASLAADIEAVVENLDSVKAALIRRADRSAQSLVKIVPSNQPRILQYVPDQPAAKRDATVPAPLGFSDPINIGAAAINALTDCNGQYTYMGFQMFTPANFDIQLCATACTGTVENEVFRSSQTNQVMQCKFFNTYTLHQDGNYIGQVCSMYSETWDPAYATNEGQIRDGGNFTIQNSYVASNATDPNPVPSGGACGPINMTFPPETRPANSPSTVPAPQTAPASPAVSSTYPPAVAEMLAAAQSSASAAGAAAASQPAINAQPVTLAAPSASSPPTLTDDTTTTVTQSVAIVVPTSATSAASIPTIPLVALPAPPPEVIVASALGNPSVPGPVTTPTAPGLAPNATALLANILGEQKFHSYCANILGYSSAVTQTSTVYSTITAETPFVFYNGVSTATISITAMVTPSPLSAKSLSISEPGAEIEDSSILKKKLFKSILTLGNKKHALPSHHYHEKRKAMSFGVAQLPSGLVSAACASIVSPPSTPSTVNVQVTATVTEFGPATATMANTTTTAFQTSFTTLLI